MKRQMAQSYRVKESAKHVAWLFWHSTGVCGSLGLEFRKQRDQGAGHGHGKAFACPPLGVWKRDGLGRALQINAGHWDLGFLKAATRIQRDQKGGQHPGGFALEVGEALSDFRVGKRILFCVGFGFVLKFREWVSGDNFSPGRLGEYLTQKFNIRLSVVFFQSFLFRVFFVQRPFKVGESSGVAHITLGEPVLLEKEAQSLPADHVVHLCVCDDAQTGKISINPVPMVRGVGSVGGGKFSGFKLRSKRTGFSGLVGVVPSQFCGFANPFSVLFIGDVPVGASGLFVEACHSMKCMKRALKINLFTETFTLLAKLYTESNFSVTKTFKVRGVTNQLADKCLRFVYETLYVTAYEKGVA